MTQNADLVVQEVALRAKKSAFGKDNPVLIRQLYLDLRSVVDLLNLGQITLPDSAEEMVKFIRRYLTGAGPLPIGSGVVFNLQGFLENKNVPADIKDLINRIFPRMDYRDLNYRFGACKCQTCINPGAVLAAYLNFGLEGRAPYTMH